MRTALPLTLTVLALVLAACADPAAVGVGSGTSSATEQPATDLPATELPSGPIPVEPDGGIGDGAGPPDASPAPPASGTPSDTPSAPPFGISSDTDSAAVDPFTYCWSDDGAGVCADGFADPSTTMQATDHLVVTYEEGELTAELSAPFEPQDTPPDRAPLPVTAEQPGIWRVDLSALDPGTHVVWLSWDGPQGDSFATVTTEVV